MLGPKLSPPLRHLPRQYSTSAPKPNNGPRRPPPTRRSKPSVFTSPAPPAQPRTTSAPLPTTPWTSPLYTLPTATTPFSTRPPTTYNVALPPTIPQLPHLKQGSKMLQLHLFPAGRMVSTSLGLANKPVGKVAPKYLQRKRTGTIREEVGGEYQAYTADGLAHGLPKTAADAAMAVSLNASVGSEGKRFVVGKVLKAVKG